MRRLTPDAKAVAASTLTLAYIQAADDPTLKSDNSDLSIEQRGEMIEDMVFKVYLSFLDRLEDLDKSKVSKPSITV